MVSHKIMTPAKKGVDEIYLAIELKRSFQTDQNLTIYDYKYVETL